MNWNIPASSSSSENKFVFLSHAWISLLKYTHKLCMSWRSHLKSSLSLVWMKQECVVCCPERTTAARGFHWVITHSRRISCFKRGYCISPIVILCITTAPRRRDFLKSQQDRSSGRQWNCWMRFKLIFLTMQL